MVVKHTFINFVRNHQKTINYSYIFLFCTSIFFTFCFRKGIEFTRYAMIVLTACILFSDPKMLKKLISNYFYLLLLFFISISAISLTYNNSSIANIDNAVNWTLCFIFGFLFFNILKFNSFLIFFALPIILFLTQIIFPFFYGTLLDNINFISGRRLDLFFNDKPIHLGIFAGVSSFAAFYIFLGSINKYLRHIYFIFFIFSFIILLSTGTRTSFIGTMITLALILILHSYKIIQKKYFLIAGIFILITSTLFILTLNKSRISTLTDTESLNDAYLQRELIFIIAKDSFLRSPVFGEGFDRFSDIYTQNIINYSIENNATGKFIYVLPTSNNAHNFSLHFLAETGIIGFLCMNFFWLLIITTGIKSKTDISRITSGIYLLTYIAFQFNMSLYGTQLSTLLFSLAGISGAAIQASKQNGIESNHTNSLPLIKLKVFK